MVDGGADDPGYTAQQTSDGGYILVGKSDSYNWFPGVGEY